MNLQSAIFLKSNSEKIELEEINSLLKDLDIQLIQSDIQIINKSEKKSSIGIEEVKPIFGWNSLKKDRVNVYVVTNAETLTIQAQNSLLKVLEEPGENSLIILLSNRLNVFLETILSRCRVYRSDQIIETKENSLIKEFIESDYLSRLKIIKKQEKENNIRELAEEICKKLIKIDIQKSLDNHNLSNQKPNMIEFLKKCLIALKTNASPKQILETLSSKLL